MRMEMKRRYMLLYRHFRLKKYGEPIPGTVPKTGAKVDDVDDDLWDESEREMMNKIKAMLN